MELARGSVVDRPWGRTLGALALRRLTGQVTVIADAKHYFVAFVDGTVVSALSPLAADAAVRIALTVGLVSSTQVNDIARRQASAPARDEVDLIAEIAKLGPDHAMRLRRRAVAQRAARTFSLERGEFVVDDRVSLPVVEGTALDFRTVVYLAARSNLSEGRLASDLAQMGRWFRLKPEAIEDLPLYGFSANEQPILDRLADGAGLADLEATVLDPRAVHTVLYALVSCNACELEGAIASAATPAPAAVVQAPAPPASMSANLMKRQPVPAADPGIEGATIRKPSVVDAPTARLAQRPPELRRGDFDAPTVTRPRTASRPPPPRKNQADSAQASDILSLIGARLRQLEQHPDHYALLGVTQDATPETLRKAYFALARQLHPDRLASLGIADVDRNAQRLFAEVNAAFAVLNDPEQRAEYTSILKRGGSAAVRAEETRAEEMANRVIDGEEAYRLGEQALKRDQIPTAIAELERAIQLNPDEADYHATLAWARFCAAPDKMAIAATTRASLGKAMLTAPRAVTARFYLGRVERMLGKDLEALALFTEVIRMQPQHAEARSEARVIEARMSSKKK